LLFLLTYWLIDYTQIINESIAMISGKLPETGEVTLLRGTLNIIALVVINAFIIIPTAIIVTEILGRPERVEPEGHVTLKGVKTAVLFEDFFGRVLLFWLPLHLSGYNTIVFYVFWFLSNAIWSALHIYNYKPKDRQLLRTLPQFLSGLFVLSYTFLKFGFWVCYAVHLFYDFLIFSVFAKEQLESSLVKNLISRLVGISIGLVLLGVNTFNISSSIKSITQTPYLQWLDGNFVTTGIAMFSFIGFLLVINNVIGFICDAAGFDERGLLEILKSLSEDFFVTRVGAILLSILGGVLTALILPVVYCLTSWIVIPIIGFFTTIRNVLNATILLAAFFIASPSGSKESTPSAEVRGFVIGFPLYYLLFIYFVKVAWWELLTCMVIYSTLSAVVNSLRLK